MKFVDSAVIFTHNNDYITFQTKIQLHKVKLFIVILLKLLQSHRKGNCNNMTARNAVRQRIIDLCAEHNITVNKLSTICGVTQSTFNNIINTGSMNPTISTITKICNGLDITLRDFFDDVLFEDIEQEIK